MTESDLAEELRWRLAERSAAAPRAELRSLLRELAEDIPAQLHLVPPSRGVADPLLERYSTRKQRRIAVSSLHEAVELIVRIASRKSVPVWLVRPGRPEQIGLVRVETGFSAELLEALALWDGEGFLAGSEAGADWMLLDIDSAHSPARCELLVAEDLVSDEPSNQE